MDADSDFALHCVFFCVYMMYVCTDALCMREICVCDTRGVCADQALLRNIHTSIRKQKQTDFRVYICTYIHTYKLHPVSTAVAFSLIPIHTHTDTHTDTQTHRHTDTQTHRHRHRHTHTHTYIYIHTPSNLCPAQRCRVSN
jgi:hypothetical protein